MFLRLELHQAHSTPGNHEKSQTNHSDDAHLPPHGRPSAALQQRIADDFYVVAAPDEVGNPAQSNGDVLDGEEEAGEQKHQKEAGQGYHLHGSNLAGDSGADHGAERGYAKCVKERSHDERSWVSSEAQTEIREQQNQHEHAFTESYDHECKNLSQEEFAGGDAGDVHLKDGLLLAFLGHRQGRQQRREHGKSENKNTRPIKLLGRKSWVVPEASCRLHRSSLGSTGKTPVIGTGDLGRIAGHEVGGIRVRCIHQQLNGRVKSPRHVPAEARGNDQHRARRAGAERLFRRPVHGPGDHMESNRSAHRVDVIMGSGRIVEILNDHGEIVYFEREPHAHQHEQGHGQRQGQCERTPVAIDLNEFFAGLRDDSPHRLLLFSLTLPSYTSLLHIHCDLALAARLFHYADEDVFQRKALFARGDYANSASFQLAGYLANRLPGVFIANHVQTISKQRDAPTFGIALEQIDGALWLVDDEFEQVSCLLRLDAGGRAFGYQLTGGHESQAIALLRFFKVVGGNQDGRAGIRELVDHLPESAAR